MNIIAVDDEYHALTMLKKAILRAMPEACVSAFDEPEDALCYAEKNQVDVAFLDIEMREMNGLVLAKKLKDRNSRTNIVFVTGFKEYALDAMRLHASGYLTKPASADDIIREIENLRHPVKAADSGIRIQCFGNFEVFADGKPIAFGRAKSKEVLAYLVDMQGTGVTKKQIAAILWEDEQYDRAQQKRLDNIIAEMVRTMSAAGAGQAIYKKNGVYAVDVNQITCDYYLYQEGNASAVNRYHGKYMEQYSWAEFTAARLMGKSKNYF